MRPLALLFTLPLSLFPAAAAAPQQDSLEHLRGQLEEGDTDARITAAESLGAFGPEALPLLIAAVDDKRAEVRVAAVRAIGGMPNAGTAGREAVEAALGDRRPDVVQAATAALGAFGPDAIPALVKIYEAQEVPDSSLTFASLLRASAGAPGWLGRVLEHSREEVPLVAIGMCSRTPVIGPEEVGRLAELLARLEDHSHASQVVRAIGRAQGADARVEELLIEATRHKNREVRGTAGWAIAARSLDSEAVVEALARGLEEPFDTVRIGAIAGLATAGPGGTRTLLEHLDSDTVSAEILLLLNRRRLRVSFQRSLLEVAQGEGLEVTRSHALDWLGVFAEGAEPLRPQVRGLLADPSDAVRWSAIYALARLGPESHEAGEDLALAALAELLDSLRPDGSMVAAALGELASRGVSISGEGLADFAPIAEFFERVGKWEHKRALVDGLGALRPLPEGAEALLRSLVDDSRLGLPARVALARAAASDPAVPLVEALWLEEHRPMHVDLLLDEPDPEILFGLESVGEQIALPALQAAIEQRLGQGEARFGLRALAVFDANSWTPWFEGLQDRTDSIGMFEAVLAAQASGATLDLAPLSDRLIEEIEQGADRPDLWTLDLLGHCDTQAATAAAADLLRSKDSDVACHAALTLGHVSELDRRTRTRLRQLLDHDEAQVRASAAATLASHPEAAAEAEKNLLGALSDEDDSVRRMAALAVGTFPGPAPKLQRALTELLEEHADGRAPAEAARALVKLGEPSAEALAALELRAYDGTWLINRAALEALDALDASTPEMLETLIHILLVNRPLALERAAANCIGDLGPAGAPAVEALAAILRQEEREPVDPFAQETKDFPQQWFGTSTLPLPRQIYAPTTERQLRLACIEALALIGPAASSAIPVLEAHVGSGPTELAPAAQTALEAIRRPR